MSDPKSSIYAGTVVHKRLTPKQHGFAYRVFALCLDVDEIDEIASKLRLLSRNRWNVLSFYDRDYGDSGATPVGDKARALLAGAGLAPFGARIELLCYPRLLGYVFNPLAVYFCRDASGTLGAIIYEVSNTFGERKSYVVDAGDNSGTIVAQGCRKELYVSPFTAAAGTYSFHVVPPCDRIVIGIAFREGTQAVLKTHFRADRLPLTNRSIRRMLAGHPLMTLKVIAAIHFEAARLWRKGVPLVPRHLSPAYSSTIVRRKGQELNHA